MSGFWKFVFVLFLVLVGFAFFGDIIAIGILFWVLAVLLAAFFYIPYKIAVSIMRLIPKRLVIALILAAVVMLVIVHECDP